METTKEYTSDTQMLLLIDILKTYKTIRFDKEFCDEVGLLKQNLIKIKNGEKHFTAGHIEKAIWSFKVNANWIFGVSDKIFLGNKNEHIRSNNNEILTQSD